MARNLKFRFFKGGGKDLAAAAGFLENRENKIKQEQQQDVKNAMPTKLQQQLPNMLNKMPPNMLPPHFDFMRNPQQSKYIVWVFCFWCNRSLINIMSKNKNKHCD